MRGLATPSLNGPGAGVGMALGQLRAVIGIGEPDRAVLVGRNVVGRVQRLAVIIVGDDGDGAVMLEADDAAQAMLGADLAALIIKRVAVGIVAGAAEGADGAGFPDIAILLVAGNVAPHHILAFVRPGRAFRPDHAGAHALDVGMADEELAGFRRQQQHIGIGIVDRRRTGAIGAPVQHRGAGQRAGRLGLREGQGRHSGGGAGQHQTAGQVIGHGHSPSGVFVGSKGNPCGPACQPGAAP